MYVRTKRGQSHWINDQLRYHSAQTTSQTSDFDQLGLRTSILQIWTRFLIPRPKCAGGGQSFCHEIITNQISLDHEVGLLHLPINQPRTTHWLIYLPQIHVSIQPVADDVGTGASGTAAHNNDDYCLHGDDLEGQGQGERRERHDAKLAEESNQDAPGLFDVTPQLHGIHSAAHGEHDHGQHDGERGAHRHSQDLVEVIRRNEAVAARTHGRERVARRHGCQSWCAIPAARLWIREGEGVSGDNGARSLGFMLQRLGGKESKINQYSVFYGVSVQKPMHIKKEPFWRVIHDLT